MIHTLLAIAVPFALLSSYSTPFEFEHALRLSCATRLFVNPRLLPLAINVAKKVGFPEGNIYLLEGNVPGKRSFGDMIKHVKNTHIPRLAVRPVKKDTLAYLIFSSGTSGLPKGRCKLLI
jgi:acyl-CoA synthetase (AMP-forming)/AMP-acid ligase II